MRGLDRVRQALNSVSSPRLEVERSTSVERELRSDRNPPHSGALYGGDRRRQSM